MKKVHMIWERSNEEKELILLVDEDNVIQGWEGDKELTEPLIGLQKGEVRFAKFEDGAIIDGIKEGYLDIEIIEALTAKGWTFKDLRVEEDKKD